MQYLSEHRREPNLYTTFQQAVTAEARAAAEAAGPLDIRAARMPSSAIEREAALTEFTGLSLAEPRVKFSLNRPVYDHSGPVVERSLALFVTELQNRVLELTSGYLPEGTRLKIVEAEAEATGLIGRLLALWRPQRSFEVLVEHSPCDVRLFQVSARGKSGEFRVAFTPYESPGNNFSSLAAKIEAALASESDERLLSEQGDLSLKGTQLAAQQDKARFEIAGNLGAKLTALEEHLTAQAKQLSERNELNFEQLVKVLREFEASSKGSALMSILKLKKSEIKMPAALLVTTHFKGERNALQLKIKQKFLLGFDGDGWFIERQGFQKFYDELFYGDPKDVEKLRLSSSYDADKLKKILYQAFDKGFGVDDVERWLTKEVKGIVGRR